MADTLTRYNGLTEAAVPAPPASAPREQIFEYGALCGLAMSVPLTFTGEYPPRRIDNQDSALLDRAVALYRERWG